MTLPRIFLFAILATGCVTEAEVIVDNESCSEGAFYPTGELRLTGDACYDDWARRIAADREELIELALDVTTSCVALAESLGEEDTWSVESRPVHRAAKACAAVDIQLDEGVSCKLAIEESCLSEVACSAANEPPWLDVVETELPELLSFCCDVGKIDLFADPALLVPTCEAAPGTEACAGRLVADLELEAFAELVQTACGAYSVLAPSG